MCVGIPNYNGLYLFQSAGGAGGTDETGTNKDAHQLPVKQRGTLRCVPAICDVLYSASRTLFPYRYHRCALVFWMRFWSEKQGLRFKVRLGFSLS